MVDMQEEQAKDSNKLLMGGLGLLSFCNTKGHFAVCMLSLQSGHSAQVHRPVLLLPDKTHAQHFRTPLFFYKLQKCHCATVARGGVMFI